MSNYFPFQFSNTLFLAIAPLQHPPINLPSSSLFPGYLSDTNNPNLLSAANDTYPDVTHRHATDDEGVESSRSLGLLVARGTMLVLISPLDGSQEIANPFMAPDSADDAPALPS